MCECVLNLTGAYHLRCFKKPCVAGVEWGGGDSDRDVYRLRG